MPLFLQFIGPGEVTAEQPGVISAAGQVPAMRFFVNAHLLSICTASSCTNRTFFKDWNLVLGLTFILGNVSSWFDEQCILDLRFTCSNAFAYIIYIVLQTILWLSYSRQQHPEIALLIGNSGCVSVLAHFKQQWVFSCQCRWLLDVFPCSQAFALLQCTATSLRIQSDCVWFCLSSTPRQACSDLLQKQLKTIQDVW